MYEIEKIEQRMKRCPSCAVSSWNWINGNRMSKQSSQILEKEIETLGKDEKYVQS